MGGREGLGTRHKHNLFSLQIKRSGVMIGNGYKFNTNLIPSSVLLLRDSRLAVRAVKRNVCISLNIVLYPLTRPRRPRVISQKWILIKRHSRHSIVRSYAAYVFVGIVQQFYFIALRLSSPFLFLAPPRLASERSDSRDYTAFPRTSLRNTLP